MKLLDHVREVLRTRHYSYRTEQVYCHWIVKFIRFQGLRHPLELDADEVERFLTYLAVEQHVSASTQNQALNALVFLYRQVLERDLGDFNAVRARRSKRVPAVLSAVEVAQLLTAVDALKSTEPYGLMTRLMYGAGLRVMECCRLRVKDVDLARGQLTVRQGKGDKDRYVMLPCGVRGELARQLEWRARLHALDLAGGQGRVEMPDALARKLRSADHALAWQFVFASRQLSHDE